MISNPKKEKFRVIVAGSREFNDYEFLKEKLDHLLTKKLEDFEIAIVSGTAYGADKLGERYANEKGFGIDRYPADWNNIDGKPKNEIGIRNDGYSYWKKAGHVRNVQMSENAEACVVFILNESSGSEDMAKIAKNKLLLRVYRIKSK